MAPIPVFRTFLNTKIVLGSLWKRGSGHMQFHFGLLEKHRYYLHPLMSNEKHDGKNICDS
jgi:hypothetical protein